MDELSYLEDSEGGGAEEGDVEGPLQHYAIAVPVHQHAPHLQTGSEGPVSH